MFLYFDTDKSGWCVDSSDVMFDVVVVGAGPIGLVLSNYLGKFGVKTLLVEKNSSTVSEPRAVSIDDESLRAIQGINLAETVIGSLMPDYGSCYQSPTGSVFAKVSPNTREYGYPRRNGVHQDVLEKQLKDGLEQYSNVETWFNHQLTSFSEVEDGVELSLQSADGQVKSVKCRYLCASDGASSFIRKTLNVVMEGDTYGENWLIIDIENTKDTFRDTRVFCDPSRPGISLPGPKGTRRFEFMLLKGE
ncbi:MAG: FAD-dependent monooxygenase, partial [Colwellia sp.]|nr:FAD-dependent monooxygenase [Colwellia sp.]